MQAFTEIRVVPWSIRMGFWVCLGLYVLSFCLPVNLERPTDRGYSMFFMGIWAMIISVAMPLHALFNGDAQALGQMVSWWLATAPWLANPVLWFALAHYGLGNGRAAGKTALTAALFAASYMLLAGFFDPPHGLPLFRSPAYAVWIGSMVCLALFSWRLARHEDTAHLYTPEWARARLDDDSPNRSLAGASGSERITPLLARRAQTESLV